MPQLKKKKTGLPFIKKKVCCFENYQTHNRWLVTHKMTEEMGFEFCIEDRFLIVA